VAPLFRTLLASTGIHFVQGEVTALDPQAQTVSLTSLGAEAGEEGPKEKAKTLAYDRLVLALGSEPFVPALPSSSRSGMTFYRLEDAEALASKLRAMESQGGKGLLRAVIVGGGYSGVELAANLAARLGRDR
jgi:NADH dehydrogenase FAD-containing subunit